MNQLAILNQKNMTMSSREIAELCSKRHDHVLRDIDNLNQTYQSMGLPKVGEGYYTHEKTGNQQYREYLLTKEQTIDLITGYRADVRIRINRRWQELENQALPIPQTYADALRAYADAIEQNQLLIQEAQHNAPKIAHYNRVVERHNLLNASQVAQKLRMSAIALNKLLDELGVYNQSVKRGRVFNQWFIDSGLGELKQTDLGYTQALFTTKGEAWVIEKLTTEGVAV